MPSYLYQNRRDRCSFLFLHSFCSQRRKYYEIRRDSCLVMSCCLCSLIAVRCSNEWTLTCTFHVDQNRTIYMKKFKDLHLSYVTSKIADEWFESVHYDVESLCKNRDCISVKMRGLSLLRWSILYAIINSTALVHSAIACIEILFYHI